MRPDRKEPVKPAPADPLFSELAREERIRRVLGSVKGKNWQRKRKSKR